MQVKTTLNDTEIERVKAAMERLGLRSRAEALRVFALAGVAAIGGEDKAPAVPSFAAADPSADGPPAPKASAYTYPEY